LPAAIAYRKPSALVIDVDFDICTIALPVPRVLAMFNVTFDRLHERFLLSVRLNQRALNTIAPTTNFRAERRQ
jgi:hypothetical protein